VYDTGIPHSQHPSFPFLSQAYKSGRAEQNPADGWYRGEIGFFDFYIIPLARKLKDCGVFGVSSDEYRKFVYVRYGRCRLFLPEATLLLTISCFPHKSIPVNYAEKNRKEWEDRGEEVVAELIQKAEAMELVDCDEDKRLRRDSVLLG